MSYPLTRHMQTYADVCRRMQTYAVPSYMQSALFGIQGVEVENGNTPDTPGTSPLKEVARAGDCEGSPSGGAVPKAAEGGSRDEVTVCVDKFLAAE